MSAYREHFERGFRDGEHDAQSGTVRQLAVTRRGGHPPVVKDEDSAYYHGYKAAVAGDTRSEDSAWAAYVAKHSMRSNGPLGQRAVAHSQMVAAADVSGLPIGSILWADDRGWVVVPGGVAPIAILTERAGGRVPEGEPAASIARDYALVREGTGRVPTHGTAQRHVIAWVQAAQHAHPNPAHLSLDGKLSSRFGRQDASHVGFDGDFSFGIGSKDSQHASNARRRRAPASDVSAAAASGEAVMSSVLYRGIRGIPVRVLVRVEPGAAQWRSSFDEVKSRETRVRVAVYDLMGGIVASLVDAVQGPGEKAVTFDGAGLPGGVYVVRILAGGNSESRKMVLLK